VSIDSFIYYGTDDLYLNDIARFVKPGGAIAVAGAGLTREFDGPLPDHLREWWTHDLWCLHSAAWWRRHWERTGIMDIELADDMPDGWQRWLDWHRVVAPDNSVEINALEADRGAYLGYVRLVGRRRAGVNLTDPNVSVPMQYTKQRGGRNWGYSPRSSGPGSGRGMPSPGSDRKKRARLGESGISSPS
jgi:hypothetical protein